VIASVRGLVLSAGLDSAVIEVGGVGLLLHTTAATAAGLRPGAQAALATTLVVREESLTLYGFADDDERAIFTLVQTVSGVGPRLALAMLAIHAPDGLRRAIGGGDVPALMKIPGIGKKGAERLILELGDKIGVPASTASSGTRRAASDTATDQVHDALVGLGWSSRQADDAVQVVTAQAGDKPDVSALLRAALRELGR
jgi:Holliday junction DNA helicase RuvA